MNSVTFNALGTPWNIESTLAIPSTIVSWLSEFEAKYSRFIDNSFLNQISAQPGEYHLDEDGQKIFEFYLKLYHLTSGVFTPLIGQQLVQSGYDASYSLKSQTLTSLPEIESIIDYHPPSITIKEPCQLDFGGVGKGYAIDKVSQILTATMADYFYINAGGDIYIKSHSPVDVGLENPRNSEEAIGIANIANQSICASSGNRRRWGEYHHIINPFTLSSPTEVIASWVVADSALVADSLATCLFLIPSDILQRQFKFEYLILNHNFTVTKSANFPAQFFS